jgi:hypothetical protein
VFRIEFVYKIPSQLDDSKDGQRDCQFNEHDGEESLGFAEGERHTSPEAVAVGGSYLGNGLALDCVRNLGPDPPIKETHLVYESHQILST